ncbi:hypothetical protein H5410_041581 [Solanum commersonii]|uniref:PUM-HD domain-containing protein n=1 Tax=Solanum commersonii TaxID=4109 RepID=A0A9J5XRZ5_SOLCO|nr:hypothetical protein H5410_041581 [Solanum commersonii]
MAAALEHVFSSKHYKSIISQVNCVLQPILYEIANNCFAIATQKSGCCVIQSCVESAGGELRDCIIAEILTNAVQLLEDQYGKYVVQHLLGLKLPRVTYILIDSTLVMLLRKLFSIQEKTTPRELSPRCSIIQRAGARDDKGNPIIRDYYSSPLTASGNTHDDMLLAKLETINTGSGDPVYFQHGSGTSCVVRVASTEMQAQGTFTYGLNTNVPPSTRSHHNGSRSTNDYAKQLL